MGLAAAVAAAVLSLADGAVGPWHLLQFALASCKQPHTTNYTQLQQTTNTNTNSRWLREAELRRKRNLGVPRDGALACVVVTDIEAYSSLMKAAPALTSRALGMHNAVLRKAAHDNAGHVLEQEGDSWAVAFHGPRDAAAFCLQAQQALQRVNWPLGLGLGAGGADGAGAGGAGAGGGAAGASDFGGSGSAADLDAAVAHFAAAGGDAGPQRRRSALRQLLAVGSLGMLSVSRRTSAHSSFFEAPGGGRVPSGAAAAAGGAAGDVEAGVGGGAGAGDDEGSVTPSARSHRSSSSHPQLSDWLPPLPAGGAGAAGGANGGAYGDGAAAAAAGLIVLDGARVPSATAAGAGVAAKEPLSPQSADHSNTASAGGASLTQGLSATSGQRRRSGSRRSGSGSRRRGRAPLSARDRLFSGLRVRMGAACGAAPRGDGDMRGGSVFETAKGAAPPYPLFNLAKSGLTRS